MVLLATLAWPAGVDAQSGDYAIAGGWFFTQTGGDTADPLDGYAVIDDGEARFWQAFVDSGGVQAVGYPVSRRFIWNGFVTQAMQKAVFQWRPDSQTTVFINVFDDLSRFGYDQALADLLVPEQEQFNEAGLVWSQIIARRTELLSRVPELADAYFQAGDYLRWYGLPTSSVQIYEGLLAIRLQRAVLQLWTSDRPWAAAGTVTVANGGDLAKQLGLFPLTATQPHLPGQIPTTQAPTDPIELPPTEYGAGRWFAATPGSHVNVRAGPTVTAAIVDTVDDGGEVFPTGLTVNVDGFAWVQLVGGDRWVVGQYLAADPGDSGTSPVVEPTVVPTATPTATPVTGEQWQVNTPDGALNIRALPSISATVIGRAQHQRVLTVIGPVVLADGINWRELELGGWVAAAYLGEVSAIQPDPLQPPSELDAALLDRVNGLRRQMGLIDLEHSGPLNAAASSHAQYWITNRGDFHNEIPGLTHYSGVTIFDRAKSAGYELNWIDEVAGLLTPSRTLEWAINTVYHRYMFLHPSAVHMGYGTASDGNIVVTIFNVGLQADRSGSPPTASIHPFDGARDIPTSWDGFESPDPAPGIRRPLGYPITAALRVGDAVVWNSANLVRVSDGVHIAGTMQTSQWRRALSFVPHEPLDPSTRYRFTVSFVVNGTSGVSESEFSTRS